VVFSSISLAQVVSCVKNSKFGGQLKRERRGGGGGGGGGGVFGFGAQQVHVVGSVVSCVGVGQWLSPSVCISVSSFLVAGLGRCALACLRASCSVVLLLLLSVFPEARGKGFACTGLGIG
jgi:hypothetical protein